MDYIYRILLRYKIFKDGFISRINFEDGYLVIIDNKY